MLTPFLEGSFDSGGGGGGFRDIVSFLELLRKIHCCWILNKCTVILLDIQIN